MDAQILFLDTFYPDSPSGHGSNMFDEYGRDSGFSVLRFPIDAHAQFSSIDKFADNFKKHLTDCDLFVSRGDFHWLKLFGDYFHVNQMVLDAITDGKPFLFQSVRGWENYFSKHALPHTKYVQDVFRLVGVIPTPLKVFTNDTPSAVGGGAVAYFRAGDNHPNSIEHSCL